MAPYGRLLLAPVEGWWPAGTRRALRALWIAVWIAVLAETTSVGTEQLALRAVLAETTSVTTELMVSPTCR